MRKSVCKVSNKVTHKQNCAATEDDYSFEILDIETRKFFCIFGHRFFIFCFTDFFRNKLVS